MAEIAELIDRAIKDYVAGRVGEAHRTFREILELDPGNPKACSYLVLINGGAPGLTPLPGRMEPFRLPPAAGAPRVPPPPAAPGSFAPAVERVDDFAPSPWDEGPAAAATFVLDSGGGLDLAAVSEKSGLRPLVPEGAGPGASRAVPAKDDVQLWFQAAKELFALGDFSGSLELIEKILQVDPDHGEARDYLRQNEATLIAMYESKLGPFVRVPQLAIKPEEVMWLNLDHRAGFLLAQIDGSVDFEALFALSGLPRLDTARILANLIADGVITGA